jgi:hypothetical protein
MSDFPTPSSSLRLQDVERTSRVAVRPSSEKSAVSRLKRELLVSAVDLYQLRSRVRQKIASTIVRREIGDYEWRVKHNLVDRPAYAYCVREACRLAARLGVPRISVIEFGVAGGNGLVALEHHARQWSAIFGVGVDVYGFDAEHGLPAPVDYRDLPYHWQAGFFEMDSEALQKRIGSARLVLGQVQDTVSTFVKDHDPAPIGAVMHDMDLYSSTAIGLKLFDIDESRRMPRIFCYFDDIVGNDISLFADGTGERLAIAEFNESHPHQEISPAYHLRCPATQRWHFQVYVAHDFEHRHYNDFVSRPDQQLPLRLDE